MAENERDWVVQPDTAHIDIAIGNDARISPELREALEKVAQAMAQGDEVAGYVVMQCGDVTVKDCFVNVQCSRVTFS